MQNISPKTNDTHKTERYSQDDYLNIYCTNRNDFTLENMFCIFLYRTVCLFVLFVHIDNRNNYYYQIEIERLYFDVFNTHRHTFSVFGCEMASETAKWHFFFGNVPCFTTTCVTLVTVIVD